MTLTVNPETLTGLPAFLTDRQIKLHDSNPHYEEVRRICFHFLTYNGNELNISLVAGTNAKEFLDLASKNAEDFMKYAEKLMLLATEAQSRIALAKTIYNQNQGENK